MPEANDAETGSFSNAELDAMRQRAAELREQGRPAKGAAKREREAKACREVIDALAGSDRTVAERLHAIVAEVAPHLDPKTWYGFPSYARDGKVVVFFQPASKFNTRYGSIGFSEDALLDEGIMWPTSFAVLDIDDDVDAQLRRLVAQAAG